MGKFTVGTIVSVSFPFSNLKGQKMRPALILSKAEFGNFILCQITSKAYSSKNSICIKSKDFSRGGLPITSYVRFDKLFTADSEIVKKDVGQLKKQTIHRILKSVRLLFASD